MTKITPNRKLPTLPSPTVTVEDRDSIVLVNPDETKSLTTSLTAPSELKQDSEASVNTTAGGRQHVLARALYSYTAQMADEITFRANDILEIYSDLSQLWWFALRRRGYRCGYIPCNYVVLINNDVCTLDAWFEVSRREAELLLLLPTNQPGTFILRPSSTGFYALSVKVAHPEKQHYFCVQHYKITMMQNGGYYINPSITFPTMNALMLHYSEQQDGLCSKLIAPCPHERTPISSMEAMEVHRDCVRRDEKLDSGAFSDVYLGFWNNSTPVAVKKLKPPVTETNELVNEATLLMKLCHPNVLQIMGICRAEKPFYMITELLVNGSVQEYLHKDNGAILSTYHLVDMITQISDAMAYLESINIIHRDLRAANVLVGENNIVKVGDFGLARQLDESGIYVCRENGKFPAKWTPIEAAVRGNFSVKSDVWSFGVFMWEIITFGGVPYLGLANREVLELVAKGYRMPNPSGGVVQCDQNLYHIMLQCWRSKPDNRPTFSRLKQVMEAYITMYIAASRQVK